MYKRQRQGPVRVLHGSGSESVNGPYIGIVFGPVSYTHLPHCRYLCLHLLFHKLHHASRHGFDVDGMLPYHTFVSRTSVICLMPVYYPRSVARLVSCYALCDAVDHVVGDQVLHRTFLDAVGQEPSLWGLVLWDGGQAVGFSYLTSFYACECGGKTLMIEEIYLKESCRGKGFGRQFFRWLFQEYPQVKRFRLARATLKSGLIRTALTEISTPGMDLVCNRKMSLNSF